MGRFAQQDQNAWHILQPSCIAHDISDNIYWFVARLFPHRSSLTSPISVISRPVLPRLTVLVVAAVTVAVVAAAFPASVSVAVALVAVLPAAAGSASAPVVALVVAV